MRYHADLWKHGNDSEINIRILKPSYLYPYNAQGFGDHIKLSARPIIVHGTKKAGKMIKGEAEIRLADSTICFDNFIKDKIGTYGCHPTESKGGSQGFIWSDGRIRVSRRLPWAPLPILSGWGQDSVQNSLEGDSKRVFPAERGA